MLLLKAFVLNYSRALNEELKYRGIHVLSICPYWVETEFLDRAVAKDKKARGYPLWKSISSKKML